MNLLVIVAIILICIFVIGWVVSIKIKNVSIVDAMWALSLPIPVVVYLLNYEGSLLRKCLLLAMALVWSLRLGLHLTMRIYSHHPKEDPRYKSLREHWGAEKADRNFLVVFLINAVLVFLLSLPFYYGSQNSLSLSIIEIIGIGIFLTGFIGESVADHQLSKFIRMKTNKEICEIGLWNYSRHPNYFFEAVIWVGIYLFACGAAGGVYTMHAPILMIILLTKVSGIPPAEKSSLKSKGDAYRKYQQTTSAFLPWFKKQL